MATAGREPLNVEEEKGVSGEEPVKLQDPYGRCFIIVGVLLVLWTVWLAVSVPNGPTLATPLPYLTWDAVEDITAVDRLEGTLVVPLDPLNASSPKLRLRVKLRFATIQPAPRGTLLYHCGGPGSDSSCLDYLAPVDAESSPDGNPVDAEFANLYNIFSISQRGIGDSEPTLHCGGDTSAVLPSVTGSRPSVTDFFPECPCDGFIPLPVWFMADEWESEADWLNSHNEVLKRCYLADHLQMDGYNVMDYFGTAYLAHDLDLFRAAIGADKLSILGESYGTWVGSVYASLYPERTDKLVIISNLPPVPNVHDFSRDYAISQQGVRAEMVDRCRALGGVCMQEDPEVVFRNVTEKLDAGDYSVETEFGRASISPMYLTQYMHSFLRDNTHYDPTLKGLRYLRFANLMLETLHADPQSFAEELLNANCRVRLNLTTQVDQCVDSHGSSLAMDINETLGTFFCPTWKQYGVCVSGPADPRSIQGNLMYIATMAGDVPNRLLPSQMLDLVKRLKRQYGVVGARAGHIMEMVALWPGKAAYPGIGTNEVNPLVMATLDDSATGFKWTQEMKLAFPGSHLVTFQGYFHSFPSPFIKKERTDDLKGLYDCWAALRDYLSTGVLPRNGMACHVERFGIDTPLPAAASHLEHFAFLRDLSP